MIIGGIDVGTTGCKLTAYDSDGSLICQAYRSYEVNRSCGEHEINAEIIYDAVCEIIKEVSLKCSLDAIGITTFGETFVLLDENDKAIYPSMLYTDPRGKEECDFLSAKLGEEKIMSITGTKPQEMYSLPKIMWIKNNRCEIYAKAKKILLMEDYIIYRLTGCAKIDYSLAARTMAFDIRKKCWSDEILECAGVDKNLFSTPVAYFEGISDLKPELREKLALKDGVKIINGAHDQVASAVGAGVFEIGRAVDGTGTVECVTPVFDHIPENKKLYDEGYCVVPYVFDGTYVCYALSFTGGAVIKWYRDNFAKESSYAKLDSSSPSAPTGILVMPHFAGAANPYMDTESKAVIAGITLETKARDLYKALMEGVTYEMMINIEHLEAFGVELKTLFATGGGASSHLWMQIKADILNRPVTSLLAKEVGACGTCMLAGVALGVFKDLYEAKKVFVKQGKTYFPCSENAVVYKEYYEKYKKLYNSVRPIL